jgi:hypothetical protein
MSHQSVSKASSVSGGVGASSSAHAARASKHKRGSSGGSGSSNGSLSAASVASLAARAAVSASATATVSASVSTSSTSTAVFGSAPSTPSSAAPRFRKPNKHYRAHLKQRIRATLATADSACVLNEEQFGSHDLIMSELRVRTDAVWFERQIITAARVSSLRIFEIF